MKIKFMLCIMLISARISFAQENKLWLSLGAGLDNTANTGKEYIIGNGFNIQADAFMPFYRKGWDGSVKGRGLTLGVNISGNYTGIRNPRPDNTIVASRYQVYGGNIAVAGQPEGKISGSFAGLAGIQARMDWGKLNLSPSVNLGYLHFKQKGYTQTGSLSMNGQTQQKELVKSEQQSTSGLVFKPQLKIGYSFARNFSFFISPSLVLGPGIRHTVYYLVPQGGFNDKNTYEAGQLAKGTMESSTNTGRYRIMELNAGITMSVGKKQRKGYAGRGGAVSSSYAAGRTTSSNPEAGTTQNMPGTDFNSTRSNKDNRLSMTPTTTRQTQGKNFGEKVAGGLQSGTDFNTTRSNRDNRLATNTDPDSANAGSNMQGRLSMTPTTTRQTQGKTFGEKVTQGMAADNGDNPLYQGSATSGENPMYEANKISGNNPLYEGNTTSGVNPVYDPNKRAMPGSPIGGIVVKGGKNPGGNHITALSDNNGEVLLNNLEAGNYLFRLSPPELPAEKSINEKGVKRSESATMARPGNPIGGIIVKGGRTPGGSFIQLSVNNDGQIGFEVLEAGNYKLIITTPDANQPATESTDRSKEKIKDRPASGLKDTLKTNV